MCRAASCLASHVYAAAFSDLGLVWSMACCSRKRVRMVTRRGAAGHAERAGARPDAHRGGLPGRAHLRPARRVPERAVAALPARLGRPGGLPARLRARWRGVWPRRRGAPPACASRARRIGWAWLCNWFRLHKHRQHLCSRCSMECGPPSCITEPASSHASLEEPL